MLFSGIVFVVALVGIALLFALKSWEISRERVLFPELRRRGDERALELKALALVARKDLSKLPPHLVTVGHHLVHEAALGFAALARTLERQAHRLADSVSHRGTFARRETRSEFLKKVAGHKVDGLDTTSGNGHNG